MKYIILSAAMLLAACGQAPSTAAPQQKAIPMDGKVHVLEQRGRFVVTRDTSICVKQPDYDSELSRQAQNLPMVDSMLVKSLEAKIKDMGHEEWLKNGATGVWFGDDAISHCPDNGQNIILHQSLTLNAAGKPYRIEMRARQGAVRFTNALSYKPDFSIADGYPKEYRDVVYSDRIVFKNMLKDQKLLITQAINEIFAVRSNIQEGSPNDHR